MIDDKKIDNRDVTFIIPFRAKATCEDWVATCEALTGTIQSILNQIRDSWRCILVCHDVPPNLPTDARLQIKSVDIPIPVDYDGYLKDKGQKIYFGIEEYQKNPTYFYMVLDADDRVNKKITDHISKSSACRFVANNGYIYNGSKFLRHHRSTFDKFCGSVVVSNIIDLENELIPIMLGHHNVSKFYREEKMNFEFIGFPAVVKNVAYGGNLTHTILVFGGSFRRTIKKMFMLRFRSASKNRDFALDTHP